MNGPSTDRNIIKHDEHQTPKRNCQATTNHCTLKILDLREDYNSSEVLRKVRGTKEKCMQIPLGFVTKVTGTHQVIIDGSHFLVGMATKHIHCNGDQF